MLDVILNDEKYNRCIEDIGELLQKTVRGFQMFEKEQIRIHGFTHSQCYILLEILKHGSLTINEISVKMKLEASTITRIMDNLVRDHLLMRQRSTFDKRIVEAILTEQGHTAAVRLEASIKMYYRNVIKNLPRGHVREIMSAVEALLGALEKAKTE
ncbi:MarR family winged helix-turn-helix transcriptional regulator [Propionispira raffinosivorans]|uniref:MarR family winged helix-turn-helix transcriptional regulator n=1 Tax=Propionispira raffinosivorans TaxID=86959 RepID=UPI0003757E96|nr:MarR family transcriptional regulator [Propionispira raffinosivorans]